MAAYGEQDSMNRNFGAYGADDYEKDCEGDYARAGAQAAPEHVYHRQGTSSKLSGHGNTYKAGSSNKWIVIAGIIAVLAIAVIIAAAIVLCCCLKSSNDDNCAQSAINEIDAGNMPGEDVSQCFQDLATNNEQEFATQTKEFLDKQQNIIKKWNDAGTKKASESGLSEAEQHQLIDTLDFIVLLLDMGIQAVGDDASKAAEKEQFERLSITFQILALLADGKITEQELKEYHDELAANEEKEKKCNPIKDQDTCTKDADCEWDGDKNLPALADGTPAPLCVAKSSTLEKPSTTDTGSSTMAQLKLNPEQVNTIALLSRGSKNVSKD
jgi:hypothetical protein